ncbi:MAG: GNAT family N-acetyltransferase [Planctomycetes bacterium]|nr:GNAT family N-acetyltransferase [Planctomycetota bacterium]
MGFNSSEYRIRGMKRADFGPIGRICQQVYPHDTPYTQAELAEHNAVFPQGQFVAEHLPTSSVAGVHFTLRLRMADFHIDDPWDVLTAHGSFADDDPVNGHTLYGADLFVSPDHQHHGLAHALTDATRALVVEEGLWRMVGASRLPGYAKVAATVSPEVYVAEVIAGTRTDPVLSVHLKDGWSVVKPIYGYTQNDPESANWAAVIQWINPNCPPPPEFALR